MVREMIVFFSFEKDKVDICLVVLVLKKCYFINLRERKREELRLGGFFDSIFSLEDRFFIFFSRCRFFGWFLEVLELIFVDLCLC